MKKSSVVSIFPRKLVKVLCAACALTLFSFSFAAADNAEAIAQKVYDRDDGRDSYSKIKMTLIDRSNNRRDRELEVAIKDFGKVSKGYIYFSSPAAIKGTAFLSWENEDREDDQFLFLPALGRVRRIVSSQKDRSFVNTDYSYEDLERRKVSDYSYRILRTEKLLGRTCWVLESHPKTGRVSQYGRFISWVAQDSFVPIKIEFFDLKNRLIKLFQVKELKQIDGIWTVTWSIMKGIKSGHQTEIKVAEIKYNQGLSDDLFTQRQLERRK